MSVFTAAVDADSIGAMKRYYSPQLERDLVTALYYEAKARRTPMTKLTSRLVRAGLEFERIIGSHNDKLRDSLAVPRRERNPAYAGGSNAR